VVFVVDKEEKAIPAWYNILHFVWRDSGVLEVQSEEYSIASMCSKALHTRGS
jgi:hypothetical protein